MIAEVKKVTVRYNGRIVGYLAQIEEGVIGFQYDDGWLKGGFSISPLSLPLHKEIFVSKKGSSMDCTACFGTVFPTVGVNCSSSVILQSRGSITTGFRRLPNFR